jgi:hypothetical protein
MGVHVMVEGAILSRGAVPMRPKLVQSFRGKSGGGEWDVDNNSSRPVYESTSLRSGSRWHLEFGT